MPGSELLLAFFLATGVFAYVPGPAMLYATAQTLARGQRAGLLAALGLHLGGYFHVMAAALGLAALFAAIPTLYTVLKFIGAGYLLWLGLRLLLQSWTGRTSAEPLQAEVASNKAFWESITVEMLNPKTALFFLAFLPQFTDPTATLPLWGQLLILGTIVNIMFSSADLVCVYLAERIATAMRGSPSIGRWSARLGGGILVALAANLATSR